MMKNQKDRVLVVDVANIAYRAFYSFKGIQMKFDDKSFYYSGIIYGMFKMLFLLCNKYPYSAIFLVFEGNKNNNPRKKHPEYKKTRPHNKSSIDITNEILLIRSIGSSLGMFCVFPGKGEADDGMANVAYKLAKAGFPVHVLSNDHDMNQILRPGISIIKSTSAKTSLDQVEVYTKAKFIEENDYDPKHFSMFLAIAGDASDDIPGVPRIGDKKAQIIIRELQHNNTEITPQTVAEMIFAKVFSRAASAGKIGILTTPKILGKIEEYLNLTVIRKNWPISIIYKDKPDLKKLLTTFKIMRMNTFVESYENILNLSSRLLEKQPLFLEIFKQHAIKTENKQT